MPYTLITGTPEHILEQLNGALFLGTSIPAQGLPIGNLTLIFSAPSAATVTFSGSAGAYLTADAIAQEIIDAAISGLTVQVKNRQMAPGFPKERDSSIMLRHDSGMTIESTGTANALLGLSTTVDTVGTPIDSTRVVSFGPENLTSRFFALIAP